MYRKHNSTLNQCLQAPSFERACEITGFVYVPEGSELDYVEIYQLPHMTTEEYKQKVRERNNRLYEILSKTGRRSNIAQAHDDWNYAYEENVETDKEILNRLEGGETV